MPFHSVERSSIEVYMGQVRSGEVRSAQVRSVQIRFVDQRSGEIRSVEQRSGEACLDEPRIGEVRFDKDRFGEVRFIEVRSGEVRSGEVRFAEDPVRKVETGHVTTSEVNTRELALHPQLDTQRIDDGSLLALTKASLDRRASLSEVSPNRSATNDAQAAEERAGTLYWVRYDHRGDPMRLVRVMDDTVERWSHKGDRWVASETKSYYVEDEASEYRRVPTGIVKEIKETFLIVETQQARRFEDQRRSSELENFKEWAIALLWGAVASACVATPLTYFALEEGSFEGTVAPDVWGMVLLIFPIWTLVAVSPRPC